jgi:hypothetical protein
VAADAGEAALFLINENQNYEIGAHSRDCQKGKSCPNGMPPKITTRRMGLGITTMLHRHHQLSARAVAVQLTTNPRTSSLGKRWSKSADNSRD